MSQARTGLLLCLAGVIAIATFSGCGGGGRNEVPTPTASAGAARVEPGQVKNPDPHGPLANLSDFQKDLLADGVLTLVEYEQGILKLRECMNALGYSATVEWMPTRNHGYQSIWRSLGSGRPTTEDERRQSREETGKCFRDYTDALSYVWSQTHHASREELQSARDAFATCVRDRGAGELPMRPGEGELTNFIVRSGGVTGVRECLDWIEQEFDMPGFAG